MRENDLYERLKDDGDDDGENVHDRPRGVEPYLYSDRAKKRDTISVPKVTAKFACLRYICANVHL